VPGHDDRERIRALTVGVAGLMEALDELLQALDRVEDPIAREAAVARARARLVDTNHLMAGFARPRGPEVLDLTSGGELSGRWPSG
jgi:hypothetical protein